MRQKMTACSVFLAIAIGSYAAIANSEGGKHDEGQVRQLPVKTVRVQPLDEFRQDRTYTGLVRAKRESDLSFERGDRLLTINFDVGARVQAGQILAEIDTTGLRASRSEQQAELAKEQAIYDELVAGPRKETIDAQAALVKDLNAQVSLARTQHVRRNLLVESRAISTEVFEASEFMLESIQAKAEAATFVLNELTAGTRKEKVAAQQAILQQLQARLRDIDANIRDSQLKAPYDGVITRRHVDPGITTTPSGPILRIVEDQHLEAWIGLPPKIATNLKRNDQVELEIRETKVPAKVLSIVFEIDAATRTQPVIFGFENKQAIVPGEIARITMTQVAQVKGFQVPTSALLEADRGLWNVFVAKPTGDHHEVQRQLVEVIKNDARVAVVRGTLNSGDLVVADGVHRIVAGQRVTTQE